MDASARRGRRLFLILATLTVLWKAGGIGFSMARHGDGGHTLTSVVLVLAVPFLWRGTDWLKWLIGVTFLLSGASSLLFCLRSLPDLDVLGASVAFSGLLGLVDVLAGLAVLFLPDLEDFVRHQHEEKPDAEPDFARRSLRVAAGVWGLALGCGAGLLLAAQFFRSMDTGEGFLEVVVGLLIGIGVGGLAGLVAGLAVGFAGPGTGLTIRRLAVTRGLIAAGTCVVVEILVAAIYGGLFVGPSPYFPSVSGLQRAALIAVIYFLFASPIVAPAGFVLGAAIVLLVRDGETEQKEGAEIISRV